jgi:TfoX/Sxy family transcriptional regulator of competence genes
MAYNEALAERIRAVLDGEPRLTEKKMFGGIAWMVNGNMAVGIVKDDLMLRVGEERFQEALSLPHARPMDFAGRPMVGMVYIGPQGVATDGALRERIALAMGFVRAMPAKKAKTPAKGRAKRPAT